MYAGHVAFCSVVSHDEYADRWTDGCQTITLCFPLDVADVITECIKYKLLALKYKVFIITRLPYLHNSLLFSFFAALVIHLLSFLLSSSSSLRMTCQSFWYASPRLWNELLCFSIIAPSSHACHHIFLCCVGGGWYPNSWWDYSLSQFMELFMSYFMYIDEIPVHDVSSCINWSRTFIGAVA